MTTDSVNDKRKSRHPFTSRSAETVERMLEMFRHSLQKSTHQAAHESTVCCKKSATIEIGPCSVMYHLNYFVFADTVDLGQDFFDII